MFYASTNLTTLCLLRPQQYQIVLSYSSLMGLLSSAASDFRAENEGRLYVFGASHTTAHATTGELRFTVVMIGPS
jgi:hypothetical protein